MQLLSARIITTLLAFAMLLSIARAEPPFPTTQSSLVADGDFESDNGEWTMSSNSQLTTDTFFAGKQALCVTLAKASKPGNGFATQSFAVTPGSKLRLTYEIKTKDVDSAIYGAAVWIEFYTDDTQKKLVSSLYPTASAGTADWHKVVKVFSVPAGATHVLLYAGFNSSSGVAWFDDITLK